MAFVKGLKGVLKKIKDTLVSKDKGSQHLQILLIGETGSGKTSFLNLLCNINTVYKLGFEEGIETFRSFNDIAIENAEECQMESKTSSAKCYEVFFDDLELTIGIVDTPGFGDTRGFKEDEKHVKLIVETVKDVQYVHCICLIINGRTPRMSANLKYVLSEVSGVLPKATINNLVVVLTNARDELESSFDVTALTPFLGQAISLKNVFYVENPYCTWERAIKKLNEMGKSTASDNLARNLKRSFADACETLTSMFELIEGFDEVHTASFMELYKAKEAVEMQTSSLMVASQNKGTLENEIKKKKQELDEKLQSKTLNKDFITTVDCSMVVQTKTKEHNTICGYSGCQSNCHVSCGLPKTLDKSGLLSCWCMNGTKICRVCGHSYEYHSHLEFIYEHVTEKKQFVNETMRKQYEEAEKGEEIASILMQQMDNDLRQAEQEISAQSVTLLEYVKKFEDLGSAPSYIKIIEYQIVIVDQRIKSISGESTSDDELKRTKAQLEERLGLVKKAKCFPKSK